MYPCIAIDLNEVIAMHDIVSPACHRACIRAARRTARGAAVPRADSDPCRAAAAPNLRAVALEAAEGKMKGHGTTVRAKPVCTWG